MCDQQSLRSACAYAQSDQNLYQSLDYSMNIKLPTEHQLTFLSLKGSCTGSSESTHVKIPHCWKSHALAHIFPLTNRLDPDLSQLLEELHDLALLFAKTLKSFFVRLRVNWGSSLHFI